ncbi:hypothetical protein AHAS_Ahas01G0255100 [Arachis hypogaea]
MVHSEERGSTSNRRSARDENESSWSLNVTGSVGSRWKKKWVAPECNCGIYAILFMSGTDMNPNRLFFRCPYFKTPTPHCKYFYWLDDYVASFNEDAAKTLLFGGLKLNQNHKEDHSSADDNKVRELEERLLGLEIDLKKARLNFSQIRCSSVGCVMLAFVAGIVVRNLFSGVV